jgi:hypothetical protein
MSERTGMHAFAFQTGNWTVRHRQLRERLADNREWIEFQGTCRAWELLGGAGNVDDHWIDKPHDAYSAATFRRLEQDGTWSIWWIDSRRSGLDSPMRGTFDRGVGTFYGKDSLGERPIDVRFVWSSKNADACHWEQAFSADGGRTWETNWEMDFSRVKGELLQFERAPLAAETL